MSIVIERGYTRAFGYSSVGLGWRPLVEAAFDAIEAAPYAGKVKIIQVKEKFGRLRIYFGVIDGEDLPQHQADELGAMLYALEKQSGEHCEVCGAPAELVGPGWLETLCPEHRGDKKPVYPKA